MSKILTKENTKKSSNKDFIVNKNKKTAEVGICTRCNQNKD